MQTNSIIACESQSKYIRYLEQKLTNGIRGYLYGYNDGNKLRQNKNDEEVATWESMDGNCKRQRNKKYRKIQNTEKSPNGE